jgi:hypothetical protein
MFIILYKLTIPQKKHMNSKHYNFILLHIISIIIIIINILTGLRIRLVSDVTLHWLSPLLPQGQLHQIHILSGIILTAVGFCVIFLNTVKHRKKSFYHLWVNRFGYCVVLGAIFTGWLKYFSNQLLTSENFHYIFALAILLFIVLHSVVHIVQQGQKVFIAILPFTRLNLKRFIFPCMLITLLSSFIFFIQQINKSQALAVMPISYDHFIEIDGIANEDFWQKATKVTVMTSGGANFIDGQTEISIQAVANKDEVYFLFSWQDATQSLQHMPLYKNNKKWFIKQNGFYQFDEQSYYEDKFAVMLSNSCESGADGTAHLGPNPIKDKPMNFHKKGYHASLDGLTRDLWHWKAVRTNNMFLADDNHISPPKNVRNGERRYTAGYGADGKDSGGYVMNWQWYTPSEITPKRLPSSATLLSAYQHNDRSWVLPWFETKPYQLSNDNYPNDTIIPSVLYRSNRFEGDRADVRARGKWSQGRWTLELSRKRDTGSKDDLPLQDGICLWVSAFDHSQIAHTRHERPFKLVF